MTFFMNLDKLPRGMSMYTALVGDGSDFDEVDFVAPSRVFLDELIVKAMDACDDAYDGMSIAGLIDQTYGEVIFQ